MFNNNNNNEINNNISEYIIKYIDILITKFKEIQNENIKKTDYIKILNKNNEELNVELKKNKLYTLEKIKELSELLEESKNIIKIYEDKNNLINTNYEKLNYKYKLLLNQQQTNEQSYDNFNSIEQQDLQKIEYKILFIIFFLFI